MPLITIQSARSYGFGNFTSTSLGDYDWIASYIVPNTTTTSFSMTSIPSTYKHLQLRGNVRVTRSGQYGGELYIGLNNDTTNGNYYNGEVSTNPPADTNASAGGGSASGYPGFYAIRTTGSAAETGNFAPFVIDISDYTNTNKKKSVRMLTGWDANETNQGYIGVFSGLWQGTAAINQFNFGLAYGDFIAQNSVFNLYGIKG
jgi:hypothetical protein